MVSGKLAHPAVDEALSFDIMGTIDIAQVDEHRCLHDRFQAGEIEDTELVPLSDQRGDISAGN